MNGTLYNQILSAVASIPIPTGDQNAINAALLSRVQTAIYLTVASPDFAAAAIGASKCKSHQSRRQFLRAASMASMAGFYVSPFFLELNSLAGNGAGTGEGIIERWSVFICKGATMVTAP